jgi:EmrB/QacA subfamily drug resistance transporter
LDSDVDIVATLKGAGAFSASRTIPLTIGASFFMEGLDSTIIATSLPQIATALNVSATQIGVALTAYLVSVSMWMAASGWLADRFEARRIYVGAVAAFTLGSIACGFSETLSQLILGRFLQGMGGAMLAPVGRLILARSFPREELVGAMSYMIIPGLLGPTLGPVIGGWITTHFDWRWIFFVNVPLGILGIFLALRFLRPAPTTGSKPFDLVGFLLVGFSLVALQFALESVASHGGVRPAATIALVLGATGVLAYLRHARRPGAILDLQLFRVRTFIVATLGGSFSRMVLGATLFLFPLYCQYALGASSAIAGYLMGVLAFGQIALRLGLEPLLKRLGIRRLLVVNSASMGLLLAGLLLFQPGHSFWLVGAFMFVFGLIHSIQLSTLAGLSFSGLPNETLAKATTLAAVVQRLAMALGISLTAILLRISSDGARPTSENFILPTLVLSGIMALSILSFLALRHGDGADLMKKPV